MIVFILIGTCLFLYAAGLYVFNEYLLQLDDMDIEQGVPALPTHLRVVMNLLWPVATLWASIRKGS